MAISTLILALTTTCGPMYDESGDDNPCSPICTELAHRSAAALESEASIFKKDYFFYRVKCLKIEGDLQTFEVSLRAGTPEEARAAGRSAVSYTVLNEKTPGSCTLKQITRTP